jgi:hypothetical protein
MPILYQFFRKEDISIESYRGHYQRVSTKSHRNFLFLSAEVFIDGGLAMLKKEFLFYNSRRSHLASGWMTPLHKLWSFSEYGSIPSSLKGVTRI